MTTKPEALRIAEAFERLAIDYVLDGYSAVRQSELNEAAAELRRLHAENEALRKPAGEPIPLAATCHCVCVVEGSRVVEYCKMHGSQQPEVGPTLPDLTSPVVNDMCWKIVEALPESLSGANFNALKPALYEALKLYAAPQPQQPAPVQRPAEQWCYSTDQERYHGNCATEAEAHAEAIQELENVGELGETRTYWIAQVAPAWEKLNAVRVGEWCEEHLDENLADEIGWDDNIVELTQPEREKLGQMVIDYVRSVDGFRAYGVKGEKEHQHTIGSEGGAP